MTGPVVRRYAAPARRTGWRRVAPALAAATSVVLVMGAVVGCASSDPARPTSMAPSPTYGSLPSYLPSDPVRADSVLIGTTARPALASQGDSVDVRQPDGRPVRATVTGPAVPAEGLSYETPTTTCTFTVTLRAGATALALRSTDFVVHDHLGARYALRAVSVHGVPATLPARRTVTFQLRASLPTGEGLVTWSPDGGRSVASWDFVVETD